jgi:thiopurine S-methyltransferase
MTTPSDPLFWEERYRSGRDGWDLGGPAPPLARFLAQSHDAVTAPARVLVPGCGRGHEAALLAEHGFEVVAVDFSGLALAEARERHGGSGGRIRWLQADLFDPVALGRAGIGPASVDGVLEHTCFCAIEPCRRQAYLQGIRTWLRPGGWLLGLFWCHPRPGGPPFGCDPHQLAGAVERLGLRRLIWQPVGDSPPGRGAGRPRDGEWLGLWGR